MEIAKDNEKKTQLCVVHLKYKVKIWGKVYHDHFNQKERWSIIFMSNITDFRKRKFSRSQRTLSND